MLTSVQIPAAHTPPPTDGDVGIVAQIVLSLARSRRVQTAWEYQPHVIALALPVLALLPKCSDHAAR